VSDFSLQRRVIECRLGQHVGYAKSHFYTGSGKKVLLYPFASNFAKCQPIFKILSPTDLAVNFLIVFWNASLHFYEIYMLKKSTCLWAEWSEQSYYKTQPFETVAKNTHPVTLASFCSVTKRYLQ